MQPPVPLVNGVATFTPALLPAGTHTVAASYGGDASFTGSTASVTETVQGLQDVTGLVPIALITPTARHGHKVKGNAAQQTVRVTNRSGAPIAGPLYLVLDHLSGGMKLQNATGLSQTHVTPGDPFVLLTRGRLGAGQSASVTLLFAGMSHHQQQMMMTLGVNFTPFVLAGPGVVQRRRPRFADLGNKGPAGNLGTGGPPAPLPRPGPHTAVPSRPRNWK